MSLLSVQDLTKRYGRGETEVTALAGVTFALETGRLLAVLGPSGSGKTTLLSLIGGLLTPSSGQIQLAGEPLHLRSSGQAAAFRRSHVGIVFQEYHLIPYLTAQENLLLVPHLSGRVRREHRERAARLLEDFGLGSRGTHKPAGLSGGERQRVAIARALMNEPDIMLVDEPTSHLDTQRGNQVMELLREQIHHRSMTCVMVTHDARMAEQADQMLRLLDGRVVEPPA